MSNLAALLERNRVFAATDLRSKRSAPRPTCRAGTVSTSSCHRPARTDPAVFLGLDYGEAIVARTAGGRVTPAVAVGVAYMSFLVETQAPEGPYFEVAIIHHTDCGTRLLEEPELRRRFAGRTGVDEQILAGLPVSDPWETVRTDVERLLGTRGISPRITVSGHVYDVDTGLVTTVVEATSPADPALGSE